MAEVKRRGLAKCVLLRQSHLGKTGKDFMVKEVKEEDETVGQSSETKTCNSQPGGDLGTITNLRFIHLCKAGSV